MPFLKVLVPSEYKLHELKFKLSVIIMFSIFTLPHTYSTYIEYREIWTHAFSSTLRLIKKKQPLPKFTLGYQLLFSMLRTARPPYIYVLSLITNKRFPTPQGIKLAHVDFFWFIFLLKFTKISRI